LKKSNRRPSQLPEEPKLPTVELKHHEFEKPPQTEETEKTTQCILGEPIPDTKLDGKKKAKKKKKAKGSDETEDTEEVKKYYSSTY